MKTGPRLTPEKAVELYRSGQSVCVIARDHKLTVAGVNRRILAGGLEGNQWCPVHRRYERLTAALGS